MFHSRSDYLTQLIADNEWVDLPAEFVTREGKMASYVEGKWYLPIESKRGVILASRISSPLLNWVTIKYMIYVAQTISSIESLNSWESVCGELRHRNFFVSSKDCIHPEIMKVALISQMEWTLANLKEQRKLWRGYRLVQWYIWCAENFPELGFCVIYARELDEMIIPGNPKGEAVRSGDVEAGALHPLIEIPLIIHALKNDSGKEFEHFQQRAAVALAQAYGRNSANYVALWEEDLEDIVGDVDNPCYVLNMPRIKKGLFRLDRILLRSRLRMMQQDMFWL